MIKDMGFKYKRLSITANNELNMQYLLAVNDNKKQNLPIIYSNESLSSFLSYPECKRNHTRFTPHL